MASARAQNRQPVIKWEMHCRRIEQRWGATRAPCSVPVGDNHSYRLMPGRDAVAGISLFGVKCDPGLPSGRNAINPLLYLQRQGYCQGYRYPTVAGTVAGLSVDCCSDCIGTVGGTVAPLSRGTVSPHSTRVIHAAMDCGGRVGRGGTIAVSCWHRSHVCAILCSVL